MTDLTRRIDFECNNCHALLHTQKLCVVFSKDEELKDKILDRTFFDFTCPRCGNVLSIAAPMVYVNEEKGFIVKLAMDWDLLLNEKHNLDTCSKCPQIKRFYGATCPNDFLDKVILLEHDKEVFDCQWLLLDFKRKQIERANTILKEQGKQELFNENNVTAYFVQREDACDGICPHIVFPNGEFVEMPFAFAGLDEYMDFDYEMQNGGICDEKSIACYLKYHKYRQTPEPLTVALVKFKDNYFFATIREEENGMYKEGDEVLAVDDFTFLDCTIEKIINTNKEKFPRDRDYIKKLSKYEKEKTFPFVVLYNKLLDCASPIATQTIIAHVYDLNGNMIFNPTDLAKSHLSKYIYLMVLPYHGKTRILFYVGKSNMAAVKTIVNDFNSLSDKEKLDFLFVSLMIYDEQFYIKPSVRELMVHDRKLIKLYKSTESKNGDWSSCKKLSRFRDYTNYFLPLK